MKKSIFLLVACAAAVTACTSTDVLEEGIQSNAIGFQNIISKESRGALSNDNLKSFQVYAYYTKNGKEGNPVSVFSGEEITKNETTGVWEYSNTRYWVPETKYYFYAYSCDNKEISGNNGTLSMDLGQDASEPSDRVLKITNYICNDTHQDDLIYASVEGRDGLKASTTETPANASVAFNFKHILTRINAMFTSDFASGYEITVSNVRVRNICDKGNYDPKADKVWGTPIRSMETPFVRLSVPADGNIAAAAIGKQGEEGYVAPKTVKTGVAYVIPCAYSSADVNISFNVSVKSSDGIEVLNRNLQGTWKPNWQSGYSYTYNIVISGDAANLEPIVFETAADMNLDNWSDGNSDANNVEFTFSTN